MLLILLFFNLINKRLKTTKIIKLTILSESNPPVRVVFISVILTLDELVIRLVFKLEFGLLIAAITELDVVLGLLVEIIEEDELAIETRLVELVLDLEVELMLEFESWASAVEMLEVLLLKLVKLRESLTTPSTIEVRPGLLKESGEAIARLGEADGEIGSVGIISNSSIVESIPKT